MSNRTERVISAGTYEALSVALRRLEVIRQVLSVEVRGVIAVRIAVEFLGESSRIDAIIALHAIAHAYN